MTTGLNVGRIVDCAQHPLHGIVLGLEWSPRKEQTNENPEQHRGAGCPACRAESHLGLFGGGSLPGPCFIFAVHHPARPDAQSVNSVAIKSLILFAAKPDAILMAFLMALELDRPWQMIQTPFRPSSGAPPYSE